MGPLTLLYIDIIISETGLDLVSGLNLTVNCTGMNFPSHWCQSLLAPSLITLLSLARRAILLTHLPHLPSFTIF